MGRYFGLLEQVAAFVLSVALALYITPLIRRAALRYGVLDHPDGKLKQQREPVPYLGGIAVYLAFLLTLAFVFDFHPKLLGLLLGGTMMAMMGLFDDLKVLSPRLKLLGQLVVSLVAVKSHIAIELAFLPTWITVPLTVAWLVGVTNAVNILDVSDGLAASTSGLAALALAALAFINGDTLIATTALALAGALLGFLRYNWAPARIYLGDTGSLFVGFMLAGLSMIGQYTAHSKLAALAPLCILIVPLFETVLVSTARIWRGQSPLRGSRDHLALRLHAQGWPAGRTAGAALLVTALGCIAGLVMVLGSPQTTSLVLGLSAVVAVALFATVWRLKPV